MKVAGEHYQHKIIGKYYAIKLNKICLDLQLTNLKNDATILLFRIGINIVEFPPAKWMKWR